MPYSPLTEAQTALAVYVQLAEKVPEKDAPSVSAYEMLPGPASQALYASVANQPFVRLLMS
ncbi:hypothetical protein GCM10027290_26530 [Micromonospora sonneratiae]